MDLDNHFFKLYDFDNLYDAHCAARKSKRSNREVIEFELNLGSNIVSLAQSINNGSYKIGGYYKFDVFEPKKRVIHALHYVDRVVQHCLCDQILAPVIEPRLIYDNAACRICKGTSFVYKRVTYFLHEFYKKHGNKGYFLRCDIRKFFDSIDHQILKDKLTNLFKDQKVLDFLFSIIDSYCTAEGKGLPMGNQTSQWFAIYYLDEFDRLIKERFGIKFYSRYMDDCLIISEDKQKLKDLKDFLSIYLARYLKLEFNAKTQIFPIKNGVDFLGFHFYLTDSGKIVRKVMLKSKKNFRRKMKLYAEAYKKSEISLHEIKESYGSMIAHLKQGHTYGLRRFISSTIIFFKQRIL
jgi:RNA-directed DNA polymerase